MKTCNKCLLEKSLSDFYNRKDSKDGRRNECKSCSNKNSGQWAQNNVVKDREQSKNRNKKYRAQNSEKYQETVSRYKKNNPDKIKQSERTWRLKNKGIKAANQAKRHAKKLKATPPWLTKGQLEEIKEFYVFAKELQWLSDPTDPLEVDHIVPLQGKNVSGLHVPWNLQILPRSKNRKKYNGTHR